MRVIRIKYDKNPHQEEFHSDIDSKFLHLSGGFGSGKTHSLIMKMFDLSMRNKNIPGGIVVPTIADYKKDVLPLLEEILDDNNINYRHHSTDKWFQFPWTSARVYVASAEKKIRGPNWGWAVINEVTLISHERYKETIGRVRMRDAIVPQIASSGTPEGTGHWLYETLVESPLKNSRIIYADTRANLVNLNEDYVTTLENSYDPIMLDAYLRGLFVNMTGSRFYYSYDPALNDDKAIKRIPGLEVHVSLDYNVAPMIATLWNIVQATDSMGAPIIDPTGAPVRKAIAFDQIVILDGADTHQMSQALYARDLLPDTTTIYPDPAGKARSTQGPPDNKILEQGGWKKIKVRTMAPRFRQRQLAVCNMLAKGLIQINPTQCKALKKDLEAVEQDRATYEKIKDNPKLTHASDGMDYFIDLAFPLSGHKPESRSLQYR